MISNVLKATLPASEEMRSKQPHVYKALSLSPVHDLTSLKFIQSNLFLFPLLIPLKLKTSKKIWRKKGVNWQYLVIAINGH
jgi:hypothetical protein